MKIQICKTSGSVRNLRICLYYRINIIWSCTPYSLKGYRTSSYASIKNGIQLSSLNMVNVRVVLLASNIMRAPLFWIRKTISSNSLLHDDQIGLR